MSQKITFQPTTERAEFFNHHPFPATQTLPDWFKTTKNFSNGESNPVKSQELEDNTGIISHGTFKMCVPITDSITAGYTVPLSASVMVTSNPPLINWKVSWDVADHQPFETLGKYPIPHGYSPSLFRWHTTWSIEVPKGYSLLVTHPIHRHDLPFFTLTGIIDADKHTNRLLLPFFIREGFQGVIEESTPIAQVIPFKREDWKMKLQPYTKDQDFKTDIAKVNYVRGYKKHLWSRKSYR